MKVALFLELIIHQGFSGWSGVFSQIVSDFSNSALHMIEKIKLSNPKRNWRCLLLYSSSGMKSSIIEGIEMVVNPLRIYFFTTNWIPHYKRYGMSVVMLTSVYDFGYKCHRNVTRSAHSICYCSAAVRDMSSSKHVFSTSSLLRFVVVKNRDYDWNRRIATMSFIYIYNETSEHFSWWFVRFTLTLLSIFDNHLCARANTIKF